MAYSIIREQLGFHRIFSGNFDMDCIISANLELLEFKRPGKLVYVIDNLTNVSSTTISNEMLPTIVTHNQLLSQATGQIKVAIVIADEPLQETLANEFCKQMEGQLFNVAVFKSLEKARRWAETTPESSFSFNH